MERWSLPLFHCFTLFFMEFLTRSFHVLNNPPTKSSSALRPLLSSSWKVCGPGVDFRDVGEAIQAVAVHWPQGGSCREKIGLFGMFSYLRGFGLNILLGCEKQRFSF